MSSRRLCALALLLLVSAAGACGGYLRPRGGVAYVRRAPPIGRVEVIVTSPGTGYVWIRGSWAWRISDFVWIPGVWIVIPRGHREWIDGRWRHDRYGWYWTDGRWR